MAPSDKTMAKRRSFDARSPCSIENASVSDTIPLCPAEKAKLRKRQRAKRLASSFFRLLKRVNWLHFTILTILPILSVVGLFTVPLQWNTVLLAIAYYFVTGLSITGGYHRYWAHRAYEARLPVRIFFAVFGAAAMEGSIRWWCRDHRAHHRYTDTDKDPYSAHKGLWWSHVGWMLVKQCPDQLGKVDISDLNKSRLVRWQHRNYLWLAPLSAFALPTAVAGLLWGDWAGGFFFAGALRNVCVHHVTFCVNSLAHYLGSHTYDDRRTPRDHIFTALVTLGEGYHNFHHEFPSDYRNAIRFYQYDPTKWLIYLLSFAGLTYKLKRFPQNEVVKGKLLMKEKQLDKIRQTLY